MGIELPTAMLELRVRPTSDIRPARVTDELREVVRDTFSAAPVVPSGANPVARLPGIAARRSVTANRFFPIRAL
jgi:hypothetical protein